MGAKFLDSKAFTSNPSNYTPPSNANFFVFHLGAGESGGSSGNADSVTWNGASDPAQGGSSAIHISATQSNTSHAAIWYLALPDVSGQGSISWAWNFSPGGVSHLHLSAWRIIDANNPLLGTDTDADASGDDTSNLSANPGVWVTGALNVGVMHASGNNVTTLNDHMGTTELHETATGGNEIMASGYRLSDGAIGWTTDATDKQAALAVATFKLAPTLQQTLAAM